MGSKRAPNNSTGPCKRFEFHLSQSAKLVVRVENVAERAADKIRGFRPRIERELVGFVPKAERTQIIEAQNVIGMAVRVKDSVKVTICSRMACSRKSGVESMSTILPAY